MTMVKEFREFIERGNVVELAVAFVMGVAFASVVSTFTERIINPLIGLVFSADDLENLWTFADDAGSVGAFIGAIINFLIVALVLFFVVKTYNSVRHTEQEALEEPEGPPEEVALLREIRDSLARR
jgi:large conductance mechanosensitive channel